jgi:hypothetical protein
MVMVSREHALEVEARNLWRAIRQDAPPAGLSGAEMLALLVESSPAPAYDRLHSPFLRSTQITRPSPSQA